MIKFKHWPTVIKKFWFITVFDWNAKIDFYDECGYWPGEEALEMIQAQSEDAWKLHMKRQNGLENNEL